MSQDQGGARWSPDGRALFFFEADTRLVRTPVTVAGTGLAIGRGERVLEGNFLLNYLVTNYDLLPDGRFVFVKRDADPVVLVLGWLDELRRTMRRQGD